MQKFINSVPSGGRSAGLGLACKCKRRDSGPWSPFIRAPRCFRRRMHQEIRSQPSILKFWLLPAWSDQQSWLLGWTTTRHSYISTFQPFATCLKFFGTKLQQAMRKPFSLKFSLSITVVTSPYTAIALWEHSGYQSGDQMCELAVFSIILPGLCWKFRAARVPWTT